MNRFRKTHDDGAVAVVVAICSLLLFGVAALAVDIGSMHQRRRATQTTADLAALAGAQDLDGTTAGAVLARLSAKQYVQDNLPPGGDYADLPVTWDDDDDFSNGEVDITNGDTRITVVAPRRKVNFSFAGVFDLSSSTVGARATAEIQSPAADLPFYLSTDFTNGLVCLKENSSGTSGSAMRAAFRAAPSQTASVSGISQPSAAVGAQIYLTGNDLDQVTSVVFGTTTITTGLSATNGNNRLNFTVPNGSGAVTVTAYVGANPVPAAQNFTYAAAPPVASASVTGISQSTAPVGTSIYLSGSNLDLVTSVAFGGTTIPSGQLTASNGNNRLNFLVPNGTGAVNVTAYVGATAVATAQAFVYPAAPPVSLPTITLLNPDRGPEAGGTVVTITGTNFVAGSTVMFGVSPATAVTVNSTTSITATSPAGTGVVQVTVTGSTGVSNAKSFTYDADDCAGENGNFGYLDIPRKDSPPEGKEIELNIALGLDHGFSVYPAADRPGTGNDCNGADGAVEDVDPGINNANCLHLESGNVTSALTTGFLSGVSSPDEDPRLLDPPGVTIGDFGSMNGDRFSDFFATGVTLEQILTNPDGLPAGALSRDILQSPRFGIVPVLDVHEAAGPGWYAVVGFRGAFIDGPDSEYGFIMNNNGKQAKTVKAYAFSLALLPGVLSTSETGGDTVTYTGFGPRVPVLIE